MLSNSIEIATSFMSIQTYNSDVNLKKQGPVIYLLQETYSTSQQKPAWSTTQGCWAIKFCMECPIRGE